MTPWQAFADTGDEFVVAYAQIDGAITSARIFTIGHALELYLKAVLLQLDPRADVTKWSHRIGEMLSKVQSAAAPLLSDYALRPAIYAKFMQSPLVPLTQTNDPDYQHYIDHQELYWVARYLDDLKYLGTVHKRLPEQFGVLSVSCNPYWERIFRDVRRHLGWPECGAWADRIGQFLSKPNALSPQATRFLTAIH